MDPPSGQLQTAGLQTLDADPPIDETAPSIGDVKKAVAKLRGGKVASICNISVELLKAGGEAMICGLHAVLTAAWHSGTIPPDWKKRLIVPIWKGKGDRQDCNNYRGITLLSVPGKVLAHLLLMWICTHVLNLLTNYKSMWHDTWKPILFIWLFPKGITQLGGGQGDAHRTWLRQVDASRWESLSMGR